MAGSDEPVRAASCRGTPSALVRVVAQAPSWEACGHFGARRVLQGMQCLSADRLHAALDQAVGQAARHFGVSRSRIEGLIESDRVSALLGELRAHHPACEQMARSHGTSLTSFVVERVTISAGAVAYLSALANRFSDDSFICDPVRRLGDLIAQWDELLDRFGECLDADAQLCAARGRKLALRAAAAFTLIAAVGALSGWALWSRLVVQRSRQDLQQVLDHPDPCHVGAAGKADLAHATPGQLAAWEARRTRCDVSRQKQAREEACAALASKTESGQANDLDPAIAASSAPLLQRIAGRALVPSDLAAEALAMPCRDTASGPRFWAALARVAAGSEGLWGSVDRVSPRLMQLLGKPEYALSEGSREAIASHAESISRRAVVVGLPEALEQARRICSLQASLGVPWDRGCKAIDRLSSKK